MSESEFPGAPTWLQIFYKRMERRDATMLERMEEKYGEAVKTQLAPIVAQLEAAISQARGYGAIVGQGAGKIERLEDRVAKTEDRVEQTEKRLDLIDGSPRPLAKTHPAPATNPSARPKLVAIPGALDHTSTIPAPPSGETPPTGEDSGT